MAKRKKLNRKRRYSYKASKSTVARSLKSAAVAMAEGHCGKARDAIARAVPAIGRATMSKRGSGVMPGGKVVRAKFKRATAMYGAVCGRLSLK